MKENLPKVTIGIIGLGTILSSHLQALQANPEYGLISVCDSSKEKLRQTGEKLGVKGFTDYHDLLAEKPDVVLVSLPHGMHCQVAVEALQAGCHVLVEKPMAVSVAECNHMLAAAETCGKHLIVTEAVSFTAGATRTGKKFKAGNLGRFFTGSFVNARFYFHEGRPSWFLDPAVSGGGMFSNVGLHRLAVTRSCLPGLTPVTVSASVCHQAEWDVEACTSAIVKYAEGGSMLYEELGYYPKPGWLNTGVHYVFEAGIVMWNEQTWLMITRAGEQIEESLTTNSGYHTVYENMIKAIHGQQYWPHAWECAMDCAIAHAAYASSRERREIDLRSPEWAVLQPD